MISQSTNNIYFATLQGQEFLDALKTRVTNYRNRYTSCGLASQWTQSVGNYYGVSADGKLGWQVTQGGEAGELVQQKVNEYGSYVKHQLVLAVQSRPAGIAKAINTDVKTLRNARIGSQLVEYYLSDPSHMFEDDYVRALRLALLAAESYVVQDWNTSLGEDLRPDAAGSMIKQGDIEQFVYGPWDVARDWNAPDGKAPWRIFSRRASKFELAAKYSAFADEIIEGTELNAIAAPFYDLGHLDDSDYIEEFIFIHLPTLALPNGRYTKFTTSCAFLDTPYPYPSKNFHRVTDEDLIGTVFGHTGNYNLLGMEQVTDTLHSVILNNQSTFGVATILGVKGMGLAFQMLQKGLRYLEVDEAVFEKIKTLDLVRTAPEIFKYIEMLSQKKGEISGINSILRGDPQGALKGASGSAMALLQSQALQFNSSVQRSFYNLLSSCGTGIVEFCRKFADEPRIVRIAGKANSEAIKEFKFDAETLKSVSTVVFEPVNPVLQTAAGKLTIAQDLLNMEGMVMSPKKYLEVLTTGNLEALYDDDVDMQDAIIEENEWLMDGKPVQVVATENHRNHIASHSAQVAQPNAKSDPDLIARILEHIQEHINTWMQLSAANPSLLIATGQDVLPVGAPQLPPGAPPPQGGPGPGPGMVMNPNANEPTQPNLPSAPKNPANGEPAPVAPGTDVKIAA